MDSKTVVMNSKSPENGEESPARKPAVALGIQSDTAFNEATKRMCGRDLCSISDLTVQEMAAIMELGHAVKNHPEDFRHALDAEAQPGQGRAKVVGDGADHRGAVLDVAPQPALHVVEGGSRHADLFAAILRGVHVDFPHMSIGDT